MSTHVLFGDPIAEPIRTMGFYEPFCSLMLKGKIETRWVREGKKPPFPKGKYLMYATKKEATAKDILAWCGLDIQAKIAEVLGSNKEADWKNGLAIGLGQLSELRHMTKEDEEMGFVKFVGTKIVKDKKGIDHLYRQWALVYKDIQPIEPFEWLYGKQGVGFVPKDEVHKIKPIK